MLGKKLQMRSAEQIILMFLRKIRGEYDQLYNCLGQVYPCHVLIFVWVDVCQKTGLPDLIDLKILVKESLRQL